jgi:hypothetical protein
MASSAKFSIKGVLRRSEAELLQLEMRRLARRAGLRVVKTRVQRVEGKVKASR